MSDDIKLCHREPQCPKCKVPMKYEFCDLLSNNFTIYRCVKCFNQYEVKHSFLDKLNEDLK